MRYRGPGAGVALLVSISAFSQVPTVKSLTGKYFFREMAVASDTSQATSLSGTLTFDGTGAFSFQGQQLAGNNGPTTAAGSGTYAVTSSATVTLSPDPLRPGSGLNGRLGVSALVASNTETSTAFLSMLVAIPAPAGNVSNSTLKGNYWIATLELPSGTLASVRDGFVQAAANATGGFTTVAVSGEIAGGVGAVSQGVAGATYSLNADGTGSANFPAPAGANASGLVLSGTKTIYASQDGSIFIGGSTAAGGQGILIGIQAGSAPASNSTLSGTYFGCGMNASTPVSAFVGSASSTGDTNIVWSRRYLQTGNPGPLNVSALNNYTVGSNSAGFLLSDSLAVSNGNYFIASGAEQDVTTGNFELIFGVKAPSMSGSGLFLNPLGVFNGASYAPVGFPISPGELITLFGTGFPNQTALFKTLPLPTTLGGMQVLINGTAVPMFSVAPNQISAMVPFTVNGSTATVAVTSGGQQSNVVTVPVAPSSPGIFSLTSNGLGPGAILHPDYSVVSEDSPAHRGETVQIYLTGLGSVSPTIPAGTAAPSNPLSTVPGSLAVYVNGIQATIAFKGLAPTLVALYQVNIVIPPTVASGTVPLAILTPDGFTDQASIPIQ